MLCHATSRVFVVLLGKVLAAAVLLLVVSAQPAAAQPPAPGQPAVRVDGSTVTVSWTYDLNTFPDTVFGVQGTGPSGAFGPVAVGDALSITRAQVPDGAYTVQVIAFNFLGRSEPSPATPFRVINIFTHPNVPTLFQPSVQGNTVTLNWSYEGPDTVGFFQIEAIVQATGQAFSFTFFPDARSFTVPNVPAGNFLVRIRALSAFGDSDFSPQRVVVVGTVLGAGDMQVTLTWNQPVDLDLHVIEPDGTHVYFANRNGRTARLDKDDIDGFGPENIFVNSGAAAEGVYEVYFVHFSGDRHTESAIAITLNAGTPNESYAIRHWFSLQPDRSRGIRVALVNIRTREIRWVEGDRPAISAYEAPQDFKIPERD